MINLQIIHTRRIALIGEAADIVFIVTKKILRGCSHNFDLRDEITGGMVLIY